MRKIFVVGTGHPIEEEQVERMIFIDSFMLHGDALVFHLFELEPEKV